MVTGWGSVDATALIGQWPTTVAKAPQIIEFSSSCLPSIVNPTYCGVDAEVSAGLPIVFTSNSPAVCTVSGTLFSSGIWVGEVGFVSNGTCSITASQPGNANYAAAAPVTWSGSSIGGVWSTSPASNAISGQVFFSLSGSGLGGVTMTLSGPQGGSTTTTASGSYSFAAQFGGGVCCYTVTPSEVGLTFEPPFQTFPTLPISRTANFLASIVPSYGISGTVTVAGNGLSGVLMTLGGAQSGSTTTNASGSYSILGYEGANYTVTPSLSGYSFSPPNATFNNLGSSMPTANFTATVSTSLIGINGRVNLAGSGLSGVLMTLGGSTSVSATTDSSGDYSLSGNDGGSYTLTPSLSGYSFSPPSVTFSNLGSGSLTANFAATGISPISVTNDASFATSISPGSLVALFGNGNVLSGITASGFNTPLPTSSGGTSVTINGIYCPLVYVSPTQINLQAPTGLSAGAATVVVNNNGKTFNSTAQVSTAAPGIFTSDYNVTAILQDGNGGLLNQNNPASPGQSVAMYLTGIGPVTNYPGDGKPAPFGPLAQSTSSYTLTVNGTGAHVDYLGLSPGWAGLGQINFEIPAGTPAGNTIPVALTIAGTASKTVEISVK